MNLLKMVVSEPKLGVYEFDEFRIEVAKRLLIRGRGEHVPLTPKVFDTLLYLVRNSGKVIGKDELMREIWTDSIVEENSLNQNISILRRIFGEKPGEQRFIVTVAGHGYRFVPEVRSIPRAEFDASDINDAQAGPDYRPEINGGPSVAGAGENSAPAGARAFHRKLVAFILVSGSVALSALGFYIWKGNERSVRATINTVAVLPFKPLVLENRNETLELGMADALISKLSGGEIVVRPLSSIRRYSSVEQDAVAAGRELGVESVLDGTIQNWGDRIRVSAKLIQISDGRQLWGGQFDEKFTDIFAVQDSISQKVAAALKIRLSGKDKKPPTANLDAYQLYLKGRYNIAKGTPPDLLASIPFFEKAIEIDPGYALAYTGLSNAYGVLGLSGDTTVPEAVAKARAAERKALEIDDTLGEAHITHCMGLFWYDWDWPAAEKACIRAIEIDPNNAEFHGHYAGVLSNTGRHAEALAEARRSRELNPLDLVQLTLEGQFLLHAGRVDEAIDSLRKTSELEPKFWMPYFFSASAFIEKGMFDDAVAASRKEFEITGGNVLPWGTYALAKSGKRNEAQNALNDLIEHSVRKHVSPYGIALVFSALDERDKALDWLEKGFETRDPMMVFLKVEPKWNSLRAEPRFVGLTNRMNYP